MEQAKGMGSKGKLYKGFITQLQVYIPSYTIAVLNFLIAVLIFKFGFLYVLSKFHFCFDTLIYWDSKAKMLSDLAYLR